MPRTPFHVLFVCLGNICRSPAGENIFRHQVKKAGLENEIVIDSAGTHNFHTGKRPDQRMCDTLTSRGIASNGSARQFKAADFQKFNLILTMDDENYDNVSRLAKDATDLAKVKMFTSFCTLPENQTPDVPDPYYGGEEGFEKVVDMLEDGCSQIIRQYRDGKF